MADDQILEPFDWNEKAERLAMEIAKGGVTFSKAAKAVGINRNVLLEWRKHPEFQARIDSYLEPFRRALMEEGIADKVHRMSILARRQDAIDQLIAERASDAKMATVPGGTTGLLVHSWRIAGKGDQQQILDEYRADVALLAEERELLKQARSETEAVESAGSGRVTVIVDI